MRAECRILPDFVKDDFFRGVVWVSESVCILAHKYLDGTGNALHIGGVETIAGVLAEYVQRRYRVTILQLSVLPFDREIHGLRVIGFPNTKELRRYYVKNFQSTVSFSVFLTYHWGAWIRGEKAYVFQHGIEFDGFSSRRTGLLLILQKLLVRYRLRKYRVATRHILDHAAKIFCVDTNFINWVRAVFPFRRWEEKMVYIPNFSEQAQAGDIHSKSDAQTGKPDVRVIVPRRFEEYRGVMLMAHIASEITKIRPNVHFRFVGQGSQQKQLETVLRGNARCVIQSAAYTDMPDLYRESDIAVIPTLWSEGTSLACIEAMSYGCAVLVTTVGGLANLVFHGYNGSLVSPEEGSLHAELLYLIDDALLRKRYIENGYAVATASFSKEQWLKNIGHHMGLFCNVES